MKDYFIKGLPVSLTLKSLEEVLSDDCIRINTNPCSSYVLFYDNGLYYIRHYLIVPSTQTLIFEYKTDCSFDLYNFLLALSENRLEL